MTTQYYCFLTGAGAPQLLPHWPLPHDYRPAKGDVLRGIQGVYQVLGYVKWRIKGQPLMVNISLRLLYDANQAAKQFPQDHNAH